MNGTIKEFLLTEFFQAELKVDAAGWRNIAEGLIDNGKVITTKSAVDLWHGGIGNFIGIDNGPEGSVDCITMKFNAEGFVSKNNKFFMERYEWALKEAGNELQEVQARYDELKSAV